MTLAELLITLDTRGVLPASRVKDLKTSLRYLAEALGYLSLEQCPVDAACREEATWAHALEAYFQTPTVRGRTISAATRRNTRNNLRVVFRLAEAHGLLTAPLPPRLLTRPTLAVFKRQQRETAPYQTTFHPQTGPSRFSLPQAQWPPDVQAGWQTYLAHCGLRLRATTVETYAERLESYLGYVATICGRAPTWEDVFDVAQLMAFLRWYAARLQRPISVHAQRVVSLCAVIAQVLEHPAHRKLAAMCKTLPTPEPLHIKRAHWVSLATLEAVAEACLTEGRVPVVVERRTRHPGLQRATKFQRGVMLKLLVRAPLRQRNVRELRLEKNLYRDQAGDWQLHFRGSELKIGARGGQVNEYKLNLSRDTDGFVEVLEEFLRVHRPRLPNATTAPQCFLTWRGNPFSQHALHKELAWDVTMRTGQRFYPHLIRTIWATEFLEKTQDFTVAATMLGDSEAVVMRTYYDVVRKDQFAKAKAFLSTALKG